MCESAVGPPSKMATGPQAEPAAFGRKGRPHASPVTQSSQEGGPFLGFMASPAETMSLALGNGKHEQPGGIANAARKCFVSSAVNWRALSLFFEYQKS